MPENSTHLNNRQLDAVQHGKFPLLVLAGAGTGKTTTIIERITYSINNHSIHPSEILALTFSVDAASNLKERLSKKNIEESDLITTCTFHAFAKEIVDDNHLLLKYDNSPTLISKDESVYLLSKKIHDLEPFKSKLYNRFPIKAIKSLLSIHDQFKQELFNNNELKNLRNHCLDKIEESENDNEVFMQLYDAIETFKQFNEIRKESSFIEYEDMIYDLWNLLDSNPSILESIQDKFKFIIIDEFQDNNFAFSEIIYKIASHNNITVVGDDDQSIYSFRGSNSYNILSFNEYYSKNLKYRKIELIKNYRSNQNILDIANAVIVNNENRMDKELLISEDQEYSNDSVKMYIGDKNLQAGQVLYLIKELFDNQKDKSLAVLCRTNSDCNIMSKILTSSRISHTYSNDRLFEKKIIKDVVAFLNLISNSKYNLHSLLRLTKNKFSNSFRESVVRLWKNNSNILDECTANKELFNVDENLWINKIVLIANSLNRYNLIKTINGFINDNYRLCLREQKYIDDIEGIIEKFYNFNSKESIRSLCDYINLLVDNNSFIAKNEDVLEDPSIYLMTVHNSKGMEFDYVVLPFLQSSKFPQSFKNPQFLSKIPLNFKKWSNEYADPKVYHLDEERRLFYVACTRAKKKLLLLTTEKRQSRFVKEISKDLYLESNIEVNIPIISDNKHQEIYNRDLSVEKLSLSASKLDTYDRCALKYKYSSLDLIPYIKYNSVFALGNIVHKILQEFHAKNLSGKSEMNRLLIKHWDSTLYFYKCESDQYYQDAKDMLENYCIYLKDNNPSPVLFEAFFRINMNKYILSGVIDRLDIDKDGNIKIYDYKTSTSQKSESKIYNSFQLPIYALAIYLDGEKLNSKIKSGLSPIAVSELSLRFDDIEKSIELYKDDIEEIDRRITDIAKRISSKVFVANPNIINCNYCDYKKFICSYYE